jgi:hypothetical protein
MGSPFELSLSLAMNFAVEIEHNERDSEQRLENSLQKIQGETWRLQSRRRLRDRRMAVAASAVDLIPDVRSAGMDDESLCQRYRARISAEASSFVISAEKRRELRDRL